MKSDAKNKLVNDIVHTEWELFDQVQNIGGRAVCQDNWKTFYIMRSSQLSAWTPEILTSYKNDLAEAIASGRNLLSEKYGYMMERTHPKEYSKICHLLPAPGIRKRNLIESICKIQVAWQEEIAARWPFLAHQGRAIHSREDSSRITSFETYLWGELHTYSDETLGLYFSYIQSLQQQGQNLNEYILQNTVLQYGYSSLNEANEDISVFLF